jgi:hypothetical protein
MFARLSAKAMLLAALAAMVFFGIGLIGLATATWLSVQFGVAGGYLIAGGLLILIPILWVLLLAASRPRRKPAEKDFTTSLFTAMARETPIAAILGASLVGVASLFLNRNKNKN